jgi:hypothetical protein
MRRLKNWPSRLAALVELARVQPFCWGRHDCCLWAADAVRASTGIDLAAEWRGTYDDAAGALRLLASLGGIEAVCSWVGSAIDPRLAASGDLGVVVAGDDGRACAAVFDHDRWLVVGEQGLLSFDRAAASKAWRVGE